MGLWHEVPELKQEINKLNLRRRGESVEAPSVSEGIHGSTEYGRLSIRAHIPKIAEWRTRKASA